jgi:hypothetical protein
LAASGSNVYVIWEDFHSDEYNYAVFITRSVDSGANWAAKKAISVFNIDEDESDTPISMAASGSSVYYEKVWFDGCCGAWDLSVSVDGGATWSGGLGTETDTDFDADVAIVGQKIYVAYELYDWDSDSYEVWFTKSTDNGVTWSPEINLSSKGSNSQISG